MFSRWNFAKLAEEMVSRWAVKRVCKFFLKKKLGQLILGDIDLDQLDVQLSDGSIQLNDLALNADYLNQKFVAATSVIIKEGSIGSLLVKMPWKSKGCQVEVDELELVLAPHQDNNSNSRAGDERCRTSQGGDHRMQWDSVHFGRVMVDKDSKPCTEDVHEGVKIIAKMVKWFLTSFHIRIKKLIVAYDPCIEMDESKVGSNANLVFRISEVECGTCVSEDGSSNSDVRDENFLGISRLMNFVKFQGAKLELLCMDDVDLQTGSFCASEIQFDEVLSSCCRSKATTPIMTWRRGGFSGNIKLSIPWKHGSLDIHKVDVDVCIDPIDLKFQPSTIKWFLHSWETYKKFDKNWKPHVFQKPSDSVYFNASSHFHASSTVSSVIAGDRVIPINDSCSTSFSSLNEQEFVTQTVLAGTHLIQDYVPFPANKNQKDSISEVLGASVDQFFECFDGMRNSQSSLGSSGMWNWTSSVFSAITAASSLASGSLHIPSEQQHVKTYLKANLAGISIVFSFYDGDQNHLSNMKGDQINVEPYVHNLGAECRGIFLGVQVCPREMRFEGMVKYIEVADYFHNSIDVMNLRDANKNIDCQTLSIQHLQAEVQSVLPRFSPSSTVSDFDETSGLTAADGSFQNKGDLVKILLLKTLGTTHCHVSASENPSHSSLTASTSFSVKLPPFVLWVNFPLMNMLWDLFEEVGSSVEMNNKRNVFSSEVVDEKHGSSYGDVNRSSYAPVTALSSTESLRGNILMLDARVILCFPIIKSSKDIRGYCSWDQFVALDFSSPSTFKKGVVQDPIAVADGSSQKRFSLHLNAGNLDIYLLTSACRDDVGVKSCSSQKTKYFAQNILSIGNKTGHFSVISMLWQEGSVTGPWILKRAKFLANFEESSGRNKFMGKGYEFAKDLEDINPRTQQEIILSSEFFIHVRLFPVTINLDSSQYIVLNELSNQIVNGLSCVTHDAVGGSETSSVSQTTILMECDSVELSIRPNVSENVEGSMQSELPGSWHCFKLRIWNFNMLSVSNIGGIRGAGFFWLAHGEGTLWGCVTGVPSQEFLLISCSNSTIKRGDGGGSNALSSGLAGSDIIHLLDPETSHGFTYVTIRCSTIVAVGGRLDWLDAITSFFSLPFPEVDQAGDNNLQKGDSTVPCISSFVLNVVDIGLSYEPYFMNLMIHSEVSDSQLGSTKFNEETGVEYFACLLAASSLILSNTSVANSTDNSYKLSFRDLGLLLCKVTEPEKLGGIYSVKYLQENGYVKVAREALLEAVLRTNCNNGLPWELECPKSHIYVDTCHDTTSGLIHLAAQLQQLFAPDMEESLVHLQNRYNNVQQGQGRNDFIDESRILYSDSAPSTSQMHTLTANTMDKSGVVGLMDEISEDAFHLNRNQTCQFDSSDSQFHSLLGDPLPEEACSLETQEIFSSNQSVNESTPLLGLESSRTLFLQNGCFPEFIESHFLADLCPLSELSVSRQSSDRGNVRDGDLGKGNSGWYGDAHLSIVENHLSERSGQPSTKQFFQGKLPPIKSAGPADFGKAMGCVLLRNINVTWRMYAGSDWQEPIKNVERTTNTNGRDMGVCLVLALSGMQFQYDIFPSGGTCVSKLSLSVQDFHLYDKSRDAPWTLVLGYYDSKDRPRESSSKAFKLELEAVRPNPLTPLEEYWLRVAILPIKLHLHQSQLDFLIDFFGTKSPSVQKSPACHQDACASNLLISKRKNHGGHKIVDEALLPYFQRFDIWPILVRVDYSPCRVDLAALRGGKYVELANIVTWKGVELQLKHVHAVGIYGWGSVCETIVGEWLEEISQNQIHKVLQGLPPVRSLVAVGSGAAKLVSLPFENYRKDKRVLKGMQRGTIAFLKSISLEAVGLGVHLAAGAHDLLLQAECVLTSIPPSTSCSVQHKTKTNVRCSQPRDAQQGIQQAYGSLSDGLGRSASALVRTPYKRYQRGASAGSALETAVRGVPAAAIAPVSACAGAAHYALLGLRNSLDPEHKKESMEKYLGPTQSQEGN